MADTSSKGPGSLSHLGSLKCIGVDTRRRLVLRRECQTDAYVQSYWISLWASLYQIGRCPINGVLGCSSSPTSPMFWQGGCYWSTRRPSCRCRYYSRPIPSRPVPSHPIPSRPAPSHPISSRPIPSRPVPSLTNPTGLGPAQGIPVHRHLYTFRIFAKRMILMKLFTISIKSWRKRNKMRNRMHKRFSSHSPVQPITTLLFVTVCVNHPLIL